MHPIYFPKMSNGAHWGVCWADPGPWILGLQRFHITRDCAVCDLICVNIMYGQHSHWCVV